MSNENTQPVELSAEQTEDASGGIALPVVVAIGAAAAWTIANYNDIRNGIIDGCLEANGYQT